MPADHVIRDAKAFQDAVRVAVDAAGFGKLVTFGIVPTRPETGYGYIKAKPDGDTAVPVTSFVEKPDAETAERYVRGGEHFWNSGMFLFTASAYLDALELHAPDIYQACNASVAKRVDGADFVRPDAGEFLKSPSDSIDYAVMEKTDDALMVPLDAGWSDVGSWAALQEVRDSDKDGNTIDGDVVLHDCKGAFIQAESRLVAAVGLEDVVIIETKDSTLVAKKDRSQDVKALVDQLKAQDREEVKLHRQVFRPWGSYDSLENMDGWQVKRLIVNPGAVLSLQKHARRAEHWVVVKGKARITKNDDVFDMGVNESTYIAIGDVHRIANPFDEPAHIIEVQCGDYLGEDDIVRIEDNYGREGTNT
jgi:mannose-1-phosphate guanylyltransferase/mannose-6-phosphate isomerase